MRKAFLLVLLVAGLSIFAGFMGTGKALAYGHQDNPIAQIEISFNCTNAALCPDITGTGGLWIWAEVDTGGSLDYTLSGCGHTVGGSGGPGGAGGGGGPGVGSWTTVNSIFDAFAIYNTDFLIPFAVVVDQNGNLDPTAPYYVLTLTDPHLGPFYALVPEAPGHYSESFIQYQYGFVPGVATQTQVAPDKHS